MKNAINKTIGVIFQMIIILLTSLTAFAQTGNQTQPSETKTEKKLLLDIKPAPAEEKDEKKVEHIRLTYFIDLSNQTGSISDDRDPEKLLIGPFPISSGRAGKETVNGTYKIISMKKSDHSNEYDCDMPFCKRLKNSSTGEVKGYAAHEGVVHKVNIPASGGCLREPTGVSEQVYKLIEPTWQRDHDAVTVIIIGDSSKVAKNTFGDLLVYDSKGKAIRFSRDADGKLPQAFYDQRKKLTLFCQNQKTGALLEKSQWELGIEHMSDRVKVTEYEQRFGQVVPQPQKLATKKLKSKEKAD